MADHRPGTVAERVCKTICDQMGLDEVNVTDHLEADLGADSLDDVEIVMSLEEEFDVEILDEEAERWSTVQDAVNTLEKIVGKNG